MKRFILRGAGVASMMRAESAAFPLPNDLLHQTMEIQSFGTLYLVAS